MVRSILHTMLSQGSVALINLAVLLLSSRYLGSEVVGKVSMLILTMAIIQSVNDIYTGPATIFHMSGRSLKRIYLMGLGWTLCCVGVLSLVFIKASVLWQYIGGLFTDEVNEVTVVEPELRIALLSLSFLSIMHYFHIVLMLGREKIRLYNILNLLQPAMMALLLAIQIFVLERRGLGVSLVALYVSWVVTFTVSAFWVTKLIGSDSQEGKPNFRAILRTGVINEMGNLSHMLSNRYNYFVLASAAMVGVYHSSTALIEKVWIIGGSISPIILTRVANRQGEAGNALVTLALARISFVLSLVCTIIVYLLPDSFFTFLLGSEFEAVRSLMLYLAPGVLCISFSTIISHYFSGLGKQKVLLMANLAGLVVTLMLSYPLINRYGMYGAALTASASYVMQSAVLSALFWKTNSLRPSELFRLRLPAT